MIIGITGNIGSGKTTLAQGIVSIGFEEYCFATPLKKIAEIFDFDKDHLYGSQEQKLEIHPKWKVSSRDFLQKVGTELFRDRLSEVLPNMDIKDSIWIELFRVFYYKHRKNYVISDLRFEDEAKAIRAMGGIIIRTVRNTKEDFVSTHKSETQVNNIIPNLIVDNNSLSKEEALNVVKKYLKGISFL